MRNALLAALLTMPTAYSRASDVNDIHGHLTQKIADAELRNMTTQVLRRKNENYDALAEKRLEKNGEIFDHARVEVTGFMSNDKTDPELVDQQIKPSFSVNDGGLTSRIVAPISDALKRLFPVIDPAETAHDANLDYDEVMKAMKGEVTDRARIKLAAYKKKEINEILAHSWGSELVYAAILNGELRPPKRLIVVGVPDDDFAKWEMLAARTGTEVLWVRADNDKVAQNGAQKAKKEAGSVNFKAKWDALCSNSTMKKISCPAHDRTPKQVIRKQIPKIPGALGHDRTEYYEILKQEGIITPKYKDLLTASAAVKEAEIQKVKKAAFDDALSEARELVAEARRQVEISHRDHDERLRSALADMATRSCASPGILMQSELDALPDPYNKSFVDAPPGGLDSCAFMLYLRLGRGADADEIRQHSIPLRSIDVNSPPSLIPARPIPPSEAIALNPETPFSSVLPGLKNLAETACSSPGRASVDESLIRPSMPFSFAGERDDHTAANLSIGLGDCPRQLFNKLIEMIRSGKEAEITNIWIRDMAAVYSRPAFSRPVYVAPPRSVGDPCRDNGNRRCP